MATAAKNVLIQGMFFIRFPLFLCISLPTIAQGTGNIECFQQAPNISLKYSYSLCLISYNSRTTEISRGSCTVLVFLTLKVALLHIRMYVLVMFGL